MALGDEHAWLAAINAALEQFTGIPDITLSPEQQAARIRGKLGRRPVLVSYHFGKQSEREYLGFWASNRFAWGDHYVLVYDDGEIEELEPLRELIMYDTKIPGDRERAEREYREHNQRVGQALREKGFFE